MNPERHNTTAVETPTCSNFSRNFTAGMRGTPQDGLRFGTVSMTLLVC